MWEIEYTDEFGEWWETLNEAEQDAVAFTVGLLRRQEMIDFMRLWFH